VSAEQTVQLIVYFAKNDIRPSQIGALLRDRHNSGRVQGVPGNIVFRVLKATNVAPGIPEALKALIKKATKVRQHPERFGHEIDAQDRLLLIESRIHHLTGCCKVQPIIPPNWKYSAQTTPALTA
jgi:ribosomal protein S15P/S13E